MLGSTVAFASTNTEQLTKINIEQNKDSKKVDKYILRQNNSIEKNGVKVEDLTYKNGFL